MRLLITQHHQVTRAQDRLKDLAALLRLIFNPARLKVKAMQTRCRKYWRNLPEASLIKPLIESAERTASAMIANAATEPQFAETAGTGQSKRNDKRNGPQQRSRRYRNPSRKPPIAAPARCGKTPPRPCSARARKRRGIMLVGEQPGDKEDLAGKPFVGPAGQMLDRALEEAGIDRSQDYITDAVKHFKFVPRGKIRLHQKPNTPEIKACRHWYERELAAIKPDLVVAMGATAAQSVFGKIMPINKNRGRLMIVCCWTKAHGRW